MGTIEHVLREEHERLKEAIALYEKKLGTFPKGRPRVKCIRGIDYLYLNRREGAKVVDEYVGRADSEKAEEARRQVEKRDQLIRLLADAERQLKEVKRALRGKV